VYAWQLSRIGRHDEALAEFQRADELDPISGPRGTVGLYYARRFDEAVDRGKGHLAAHPTYLAVHQWLGLTYEQKGMYKEAIAEFQVCQQADNTPDCLAFLGHVYAVSGERDKALEMLAEIKKRSQTQYVSPFFIAMIYTGLGEKEAALDWLERAYRDRSYWMVSLKVNPQFDTLRAEPRFQNLLRLLNFPQ
jgi:tetratricopeptide (TPR) repeat protein